MNLGWKLALVEKGLSPSSILSTYNSERLPVIAEMLQRTTVLLDGLVGSKGNGSDFSSWRRTEGLTQLGVNYRWSEIVIDERGENGTQDRATGAYGLEGDPIQAGDRAPDVPKLKDIRASSDVTTTTPLFQIFSLKRHTALLFTGDSNRIGPVLDALDRYPSDTVSSVLILPREITFTHAVDRVEKVLQDTEGHAYEIYGVRSEELTVFLIRPDGTIGAIVSGVEGIERYRQLIFS